MLELEGEPFSVGRAKYLDTPPASPGESSRIYVKIEFEGDNGPVMPLALLDTGAEWSVLEREIAESVGLTGADGQAITLKHKNGTSSGKLVKANVRLLADEGEDLVVEATVFVPDEHHDVGQRDIGGVHSAARTGRGLGVGTRLTLDPQNNQIYFGGY